MTIKTLYPHTLSQITGSKILPFNDLKNLKNDNATYATTDDVRKNDKRNNPATITATNFKADLPAGAKINKITVEYAADYAEKTKYGGNGTKPSVNILNISGETVLGKGLTTTMTKTSVTWLGDHTIANINSSDFGVRINFPVNSKASKGFHVKMKYIRIIIDYTLPNFSVTSKIIGNSYVDSETQLQLTVSNINGTNKGTDVQLNLDENIDFIRKESGSGSIAMVGTNRVIWKSGIGSNSSVSVVLIVKSSFLGQNYIPFSETGSNHSGRIAFETGNKPVEYHEEVIDDTPEIPIVDPSSIVQVAVNEEFNIDLNFENLNSVELYACIVNLNSFGGSFEWWSTDYCTDDIYIYMRSQGQWAWRSITEIQGQSISPLLFNLDNGLMQNKFKCSMAGEYVIAIYDTNHNRLKQINLSVKPVNLTAPNYSILELDTEEMNRLGHTIGYTVQDFLKLETSEIYVRDWGKNFRIGVFNNRIESNVNTIAVFSEVNNNSVSCSLTIPVGTTPVITSDEDITITHNGSNYIFTKKDDNSNVLINIDFIDNEGNVLSGGEYYINFDESTVILIDNEYDSTDYDNLLNSQIFNNAEYWSEPFKNVNSREEVTCDFVYNENYPLYIILADDYPESNIEDNNFTFTEQCVIESAVYHGWEKNGNFPVPILNLLLMGDASELTLNLFEKSNSFVLYDFPLGDNFGVSENFSVSGIEVTADVEYSDQLSLSAKLMKSDGKTGERSIIINDADVESDNDNIIIGGKYDLWGFNISDMTNLEGWRIELSLNNIFTNANDIGEIKLKNIQLNIYSRQIKSNILQVYVENENVRHLGMFVKKTKVPEGLSTDTKYITIDGTDTNDPYRMNIKQKEIEIEFNVTGCDLIDTTEQLRQLAKLFVNERDELNRPIPKKLELSTHPGMHFMYIMEEPFDVDPVVTNYNSKLKLTIPSGTSFANNETITNTTGINNGIAKVSPVITIIPTGDNVEINELIRNQNFKITYADWSSENTVEIDCINRKITLMDWVNPETDTIEEKDITFAGDINNDWFVINREYEFKGDNCVIQTVSFTERY